MFARTKRLMLRPGWIEDAPELARAIGHSDVVRNLGRAPWPYTLGDAETFLSVARRPTDANLLICEIEHGNSRIVGSIGFGPYDDEPFELGYWITPDAWGRGYATEAGAAVLGIARSLGISRLAAGHYVDNPASGRVLRKLGFQPTGRIVPRYSRGRGCDVSCVEFEHRLVQSDCTDPCDRMAA